MRNSKKEGPSDLTTHLNRENQQLKENAHNRHQSQINNDDRRYRQQYQDVERQHKIMQSQYYNLTQQEKQLTKKYQTIVQNKQKYQKELQDVHQQLAQKNQERKDKEQELDYKQKQIKNLSNQQKKLKVTLKNQNKYIKEQQLREQSLIKNIESQKVTQKELQVKIMEQEKKKYKIQPELSCMKPDRKAQLIQAIKKAEQDNDENKQSIVNIEERIKTIKEKYEQLSMNVLKRKKQEVDLKEKLSNIHQQLPKYQKRSLIANIQHLSQDYKHLFAGDILDQSQDYKQYLIQLLQKRIKAKITKTKLLYRYDPLNRINFHQYFDHQEQIVVLVKLTNGFILGGWSAGSFVPSKPSKKDGLIFSLTNRKVFQPLQPNTRATVYDSYFLIFGNSEIRIKSMQAKIFSNFGISNGYYRNNGETVDVLLGSEMARQVPLITYEIFELKLR